MQRVPVHTVDDAPAGARESLRALQQEHGTIINIHGAMAHSPVLMGAYMSLKDVLSSDESAFDLRIREVIALSLAALNDCFYCQSVHTMRGRKAGLSLDETLSLRRGEPIGETPVDTLVDVVREAYQQGGKVSDDVWQAARTAGWSEAALAETCAHIAFNCLTNFFNNLAQNDLDVRPAPSLDLED